MPDNYFELTLRLLAACILGGIIGYEREQMPRPAGFRTHILVCVGSALVMITSEFIYGKYSGQGIDPARLGAQVISGIGFLGAGTIIREGFSVKGLTTAASLWAVSCVGLAVGSGFYEAAVAATILIFLTLMVLKKMEDSFSGRNSYRMLNIQSANIPGQSALIDKLCEDAKVQIKKMDLTNDESARSVLFKLNIWIPSRKALINVMDALLKLEGIQKVYED